MAAPIRMLPGQSMASCGRERSAMPQTSSARARPVVRSMPMRFASAGVSGERTANRISGNELIRPAAVADNASCCWICSNSGPTLVRAARRLAAISIMPTISRTGRCKRRRGVAVVVGDEAGCGMGSSHQGMQSISAAWRDALIDVNAYVPTNWRYPIASVGKMAHADKGTGRRDDGG